ncbi:hypothetical protein L228DRAFT_243816 [Xylona heveae TC161]|uniref:Flavin reductase like domain-containing protein n=1 Tax=Xylona heveae (strain CBS 132557 / TC161) TaxID=1328760 RepID=A0A165IKM8_XYLHT|nr:hypothetical protein L228DRAFT_243816 [Xylona heveae TC161]KZF25035.1 hypothetical protein L228DRAFT_243816 [Xylona heveae TC161]
MILATRSGRGLHHAMRRSRAERKYATTIATAAQQFYRAFFQWTRDEMRSNALGARSICQKRNHQISLSSRAYSSFSSINAAPAGAAAASSSSSYSSSTSPSSQTTQQSRHNAATLAAATDSEPNPLSTRTRHLFRKIPHPVVLITTTQPQSSQDPQDSPQILEQEQAQAQAQLEHRFRGMTVSSFTSLTLDPFPIIAFNVLLPSRTYAALAASGEFLVHVLAANQQGADVAGRFTKGDAVGAFRSLAQTKSEPHSQAQTQTQTQSSESQASHAGPSVGILRSLRNDYLSPRRPTGSNSDSANKTTEGLPLVTGPGVMHVLRCELFDPFRGVGVLSANTSSAIPSDISPRSPPTAGAGPGAETGVRVGSHVIVMGKVVGVIDRDSVPSSSTSSSASTSSSPSSDTPTETETETDTALVYVDRKFGRVGGDLH